MRIMDREIVRFVLAGLANTAASYLFYLLLKRLILTHCLNESRTPCIIKSGQFLTFRCLAEYLIAEVPQHFCFF